jgi:Predicted 6-phosphogluconate dehydrogenase
VITAALMERFATQGSDVFAGRILSAMRAQFGGHAEKTD